MNYLLHTLPQGLRLRRVHPIHERDGSCSRIYDLERSILMAVPEELRYHVAAALDTGNLDGDLISWLAGEDVLTYDSPPETGAGCAQPSVASASLDDTVDRHMDALDRVFFYDDEIHCRLSGLDAAAAVSTLRSVLRRAGEESRVVFHLSTPTAGGFPEALMPVAIAVREGGLAESTRARRVDLELLTDGRGLGRGEIQFLASSDFLVRLSGPHIEALNLLVELMPERVVMSILLDTEDRLRDLWHEARELGVKRVDAVKVTDKPFAGLHHHESELRRFRRDLFAISDDMFAALESGQRPALVYEPIAQVVGRQMATPSWSRSRGYLGVVSHGEVLALPQEEIGPVARGEEPQAGLARCRTCWARELCVRGRWAGPAADPHRPQPRADRCEFWRAEVEAGLLFYERLREADLRHLAGFVAGRREVVFDPYAHLETRNLQVF